MMPTITGTNVLAKVAHLLMVSMIKPLIHGMKALLLPQLLIPLKVVRNLLAQFVVKKKLKLLLKLHMNGLKVLQLIIVMALQSLH